MKGEVTGDRGDEASHIVLGVFYLVQDQYSVPRHDHDFVSGYILSRDFEETGMSFSLSFLPQVVQSHDIGFIDML